MARPQRLSAKLVGIQVFALVVALAWIGATLLVSWRLEGSAAAINDAGSLRMRTYRLAYLAEEAGRDGMRAEIAGLGGGTEAELLSRAGTDPRRVAQTQAALRRLSDLEKASQDLETHDWIVSS